MSKIVENATEILYAVRNYFDGDLTWCVHIESLSIWLETQNISIGSRDLCKLFQEHKDEFEIKKAQNNITIKLKRVVESASNRTSTGNGSYIKAMIEIQQAEFHTNDTKSHLQENVNRELTTGSLFYEEDTLTNSPLSTSSQPITIKDNLIEQPSLKKVVKENKALECAKKYLNLHIVDSIFELEKHMKSVDVINGSEFQDFIRENNELFQIFSEQGVTCVKLSNPSIKLTEHSTTMIKNRFTQTKLLVKNYIVRHGGSEGVTITELNIYLRGARGSTVTDELEEFLKCCKDSFECILKNGKYYVKLIPQPSKPVISTLPNNNRNRNESSILQLIREFLVKQTIASITEVKGHLKAYITLPTPSILDLEEFITSYSNEFKFRRIDGNLYLRLRPTDVNIVSYARKYLLESGKVRFSAIEDYLKHQDMCPSDNLKELLHSIPDFKLTEEQSIFYVQSQDVDIARHLRQFLKGKGEVLISSVNDYLSKKNIILSCKLIEFLENYPEFIISQGPGPTDFLVKYSSAPNEISPKGFVRKYVMFEGGKVSLNVLVSHLNWNDSFPEFKLVELIHNSEEFVLQTFGNEPQQWVIIKSLTNASINKDLNDAQKLNLTINEDNNDSLSSTGKITSPKKFDVKKPETLTAIESNQITIPNTEVLEDQEKTSSTKLTESDTSPRTHTYSMTSSNADQSIPQTPVLSESLNTTVVQFTKSLQLETKTSTSLQFDAIPQTNAQNMEASQSETYSVTNEQILTLPLTEPLISDQINSNDRPKEARNTANDIQELVVRDESSVEDMSYQNPLFFHSLLKTDRFFFDNYTSLGILESIPNEIVYLNGDHPFSIIITGLPNSGVSQTKNTILEGFLIQNTRLGKLNSPFSALIFRYDNSTMALPCESVLVATPAKYSGMFDQDTRAEKVVVLVAPSNYKNMLKLYASINNCEVIPLLFSENDLCRSDVESWINIEGDAQIHEQAKELTNDILYSHMDDQFNYTEFCIQLYNRCINNPRMKAFFSTRLGKLNTFIVEKLKDASQNKSLIDRFIPLKKLFLSGVAVIIDLSDSLLGAKMASELFNIILGIYTRINLKTQSHICNLVVLNEVHKFLAANTSLATTIHHLQSYPQHYKVNLVMTTYEPTLIPIPILLQSNLILLHHFSSPLWSQFLLQHIPFPEGNSETLTSKVRRLRTGKMIIFCPYDDDFNNSQDNSSHVVILRKRITAT